MRWFKHLTGSLKDPMISDAITEFGGDGYLVFFGILDLMSEDFDVNNPGVNTFSMKYLTKNLQISRKKLTKILRFFEKFPKNNGKITHVIDGDTITLKCDRLSYLSDEWTQRQLKKNSGVARDLVRPKEVDIEKEEDNTPPTPPLGGARLPVYHSDEYQDIRTQAKEVLAYLNLTCNRKYSELPGILSPIIRRLNDGFSPDDLKRVIDTKSVDPLFQRKRSMYSPDVLFGEKFDKYIGESPDDYETAKPEVIEPDITEGLS